MLKSPAKHLGRLVAKSLPNNLKTARFAVVVSKKVSPLAVVRNRLRRQVMGAIEANLAQIDPGRDWTFILKKGFAPKDFYEALALKTN